MGAEWWSRGKPTVLGTASGAVAGLVAITPACGFVRPVTGIVIGGVAGARCYAGCNFKKRPGGGGSLDGGGGPGGGGGRGAGGGGPLPPPPREGGGAGRP